MDLQHSFIKTQRAMVTSSLHKFQVSLVLVVLVVILGATGFYYIESVVFLDNDVLQENENAPKSMLDAFYWAIETITTTGYGDIHPRTNIGKLWVIGFSVIGLITLAYAGAYALAFIVEGHLTLAVRERKMAKEIATLKDHFIICGIGRVGKEIVRQFRGNPKDYIVIDRDADVLEDTLRDDELRIIGDPTQDEIIKEARIDSAYGLITCLPSDADNVFTILTAKGLNPNLFIIARGENESSRNKLLRAGANRVVLPAHIGGVRMASMAIRPAVVDFLEQTILFTSDQEPLFLEEIAIEQGNPFIGKMLKETKIKSETEVLVLGVKKRTGALDYNPSSNYIFQEGDILIGMGQQPQFALLRKLISSS